MSTAAHLGGAGLPDDSRGPNILAAVSITTGAALTVVLARLYVRSFIVRNVGLDVGILLPITFFLDSRNTNENENNKRQDRKSTSCEL